MPNSALLYFTLLHSTLLYCTLLHSTVLYSALLYCTLLHSTLLYFTLHQCHVLTDNCGLQIDEDGAGHVFAGAGLAEERVEGVVIGAHRLVTGHLAIRLDAVLQAVELPAGVTDLDTRLTHVDGDTFALMAGEEGNNRSYENNPRVMSFRYHSGTLKEGSRLLERGTTK